MTLPKGQRVLGWTFLLTLAFCVFEYAGGRLSGSLALVADATHMLADLGALGIAFFAGWVATKPATRKMTYGFYRVEILSALLNAALLLTVSVFIVYEALRRLRSGAEVRTPVMLAVAAAGLAFNVTAAMFLSREAGGNVNLRAALFHILSDTLSSVATLIAGGLILGTGWRYADPAASCLIAVLIVASALRLLADVVGVLLEAAPRHIDVEDLEKKILAVRGVVAMHDLHVWSLTSGLESLSAHLEVAAGADTEDLLHRVNEVLACDFRIEHTTLQLESSVQRKHLERHRH